MSGSFMLDVLSGGDLDYFLEVDGAYDLALTTYGAIDASGFSACPWGELSGSSANAWKTGDPYERREPGGLILEEWLRNVEKAHDGNDLATNFDDLIAWLLPSGGAAATLADGGTQFNGHLWMKRSWWLHIIRQQMTLWRAISGSNLWILSGNHSGSGTISGSTFSGAATNGVLTGPFAGGDYTVTVSGSLTSGPPTVNGTFSGTLTGDIAGTFVGTIISNVVSVVFTITSPTGTTITASNATFAVTGGGTTFTFSGSFVGTSDGGPELLAERRLNAVLSWATPNPQPILNGKMKWGNYRALAFPWTPSNGYGGQVFKGLVGWNNDPGQADWDEAGTNFASSVSAAGSSGLTAGVTSSNGIPSPSKSARWMLFGGGTFLCSSGSTITRPASTLRNLFGFDEDSFLRVKITSYSEDAGITTDLKVGFFWFDGRASAASYFRDLSTILGSVGTSEGNFSLTPVLDLPWQTTAGVSSGTRIPMFWIGPEYGSVIPTDVFGGPGLHAYCQGSAAVDIASTAGVNHLLRWSASVGGFNAPRIGTTKYPFTIQSSDEF
jgi:hypothetical protein